MNIIRLDYSLVTVRILYFMPDYHCIVQEFSWQTLDLSPRYPRIQRFLDYWRREIDAVIKEITISDSERSAREWRHGTIIPL